MRFSAVAASLLPISAAYAATFNVMVGGNKQIIYTPNQLTGVQTGDIVLFQFQDLNHTVTQSIFNAPCSNITDTNGVVTGVDSGFQFVNDTANLPVWQITVNNASAPLWFFCRQAKHCQSGMVFAINPTAQKSYQDFVTNAAKSLAADGSADPNAASNSTTNTSAVSNSTSSTATDTANSGASSTAAVAGSSISAINDPTPTPSATGTGSSANGAGAIRFGSGAVFMSLAGLALGLLL